jgi:MFS family permease
MSLVTAIISSLGAPFIPIIARQFRVSVSTAQWSLTLALFAGAIGSPVMGRLGDGRHRKLTTVGGLVVVGTGCVLAALAPDFAVLLVGRTMQGVGIGLVPLGMATARDEMPAAKVASTVAILSVTGAAGIGAGYPLSGLIADAWGIEGAFWFGAIATGTILLGVIAVLPSTAGRRHSPRLDLLGASVLTISLVTLLVGIAQGSGWGWTSLETAGFLVVGIVLLVVWAVQQMHVAHPLVEVRLLRHPAVLAANACGLVLGGAMYMSLTGAVEFVQAPRSVGYGFSASVVVAGTVLVPMSLCMVFGSRLLPVLMNRIGAKRVLMAGSLEVGLGAAVFAVFHGQLFEAFVLMGLMGAGLGVTFAAIPGLIVSAVPPSETGSALGFYQVVRSVGFAVGSALAASEVSGVLKSTGLPTVGEYTTLFWISAAVCVASAGVTWALPTPRTPAGHAPPAADAAPLG